MAAAVPVGLAGVVLDVAAALSGTLAAAFTLGG